MAGDPDLDNLPTRVSPTVPRMVGESDITLLRWVCEKLPEKARLLEFGPFLGAVTEVLAEYGRVDVVDRFEWTDLNDAAFPGVAGPGSNFRPLFERNMADKGITVGIHEAVFQDFAWDSGAVDLVFIDAPRTAAGLMNCLRPVADALRMDGYVLIKNGYSPRYVALGAIIEILCGLKMLEPVLTTQPPWCSLAVLKPGPAFRHIGAFKVGARTFAETGLSPNLKDAWGGAYLSAARLAERILSGEWRGAYTHLTDAPRDTDLLYAWDRLHAEMPRDEVDNPELATRLACFAELVAAQIDPSPAPVRMTGSLALALRAWWTNGAGQDWQATALDPMLLGLALDNGAMTWPERLGTRLRARKVIEIGKGLEYAGIGYLTAGVRDYVGLETGNLTAMALRIEAAMPPVTYLPLNAIKPDRAEGAELCLVHETAINDPALAQALSTIKPAMAAEAEILLLPENADQPRKFRL